MSDKEEKNDKKESLVRRYCCCACCFVDEEKDGSKKDFQYENWKELSDSPDDKSKTDETLSKAKAASEKARRALEGAELEKVKKENPEDPIFVAESREDEKEVKDEQMAEVIDESEDEGEKEGKKKGNPGKAAAGKKKDEVDEKIDQKGLEIEKTDEEAPKGAKDGKKGDDDADTERDDKGKKVGGAFMVAGKSSSKPKTDEEEKPSKGTKSKGASEIDANNEDGEIMKVLSNQKESDTKERNPDDGSGKGAPPKNKDESAKNPSDASKEECVCEDENETDTNKSAEIANEVPRKRSFIHKLFSRESKSETK